VCCLQVCSDAVDLCCDTVDSVVSRDSLSLDGRSVPDVITSSLTLVESEPESDITRSSKLSVTNSLVCKDDSQTNSTSVQNAITVPSIVVPTSSALDNSAAVTSRVSKISLANQQRLKSLDQEFTLLNLDIPNITIHSVCLCF